MTAGAAAPGKSRWSRWVGVALGAVVVAGVVLTVAHNWHDFVDSWRRIGLASGCLSLAFGALGVAATWRVWHAVLDGLDVDLDVRTSARVFFVSQLGKYVPGSVWPIVLQVEAGRRKGASRTTIVAGNVVVLAVSLTTGLAVAAVLLPFSVPGAMGRFWWALAALPLVALAAYPPTLPGVLDRVLVVVGREPIGVRLSGRATAVATAWSLVAWVLFGAHVAVLVDAMGAGGPAVLALATGGMALAICAGVLFIPAPAGAGPREVALAYVLAGVLAGPAILAVIVASRVILIAADLLLAGMGGLARRRG